jgi:hypothetical protein
MELPKNSKLYTLVSTGFYHLHFGSYPLILGTPTESLAKESLSFTCFSLLFSSSFIETNNPYSIQKFCFTYLSISLYLISKDQDFIYTFFKQVKDKDSFAKDSVGVPRIKG